MANTAKEEGRERELVPSGFFVWICGFVFFFFFAQVAD